MRNKYQYGQVFKNTVKIRAERKKSAMLGRNIKLAIENIEETILNLQEAMVYTITPITETLVGMIERLEREKADLIDTFDEDIKNSIRMKDAGTQDCDW